MKEKFDNDSQLALAYEENEREEALRAFNEDVEREALGEIWEDVWPTIWPPTAGESDEEYHAYCEKWTKILLADPLPAVAELEKGVA